MTGDINFYDLIFIDIETVPLYGQHAKLNPVIQQLWSVKHATLKRGDETAEDGYLKCAGVYAEFAKIVCISIGFFRIDRETKHRTFRVKSFYGDDEKVILEEFCEILAKSFHFDRYHFCGHNIREFDIPFICRRLLINYLPLPDILNASGKRPWEMQDIDTLQLWKFGDYKSYTSLKLLAEVLGIPTPKDEIEGKDVCRVYWQENGLSKIVEYCQKDVVTVARLLLRIKGEEKKLEDSDITIVT